MLSAMRHFFDRVLGILAADHESITHFHDDDF